jgi:hypothetical protein
MCQPTSLHPRRYRWLTLWALSGFGASVCGPSARHRVVALVCEHKRGVAAAIPEPPLKWFKPAFSRPIDLKPNGASLP